MPGKFALVTHPYNLAHLRRILAYHRPGGRLPSDALLLRMFEWTPSFKLGEWRGVRSATGATVDGYDVTCPIMPEMKSLGPRAIFKKIRDACVLASELGAHVVGLGGFTSIYGEFGRESAGDDLDIGVTTGNSLTAVMAVRGIRRAAELLGVELSEATVAVVGATGDIGTACCRALAPEVGCLDLTARARSKLVRLAAELEHTASGRVHVADDNRHALCDADFVICVASASEPIIQPQDLRAGTVVCDVGYPKNVATRVAERDDVFVFDGGLVGLPSPIDFGFDNGLPSPHVLYGCFAESIVLALESRFESFSQGRGHITPERMDAIGAMADTHGFGLAPFYSGGRRVPDDELAAFADRLPRQAGSGASFQPSARST
ncbi:MAG: shikimate dehydrogenase [Planctomycetota bacterium]